MRTRIKLEIADIVIAIRSDFPLGRPQARERAQLRYGRFKNFLYRGSRKPGIIITVTVTEELPCINKGVRFFVTHSLRRRKENWRIGRYERGFVYSCPMKHKEMRAFMDKDFRHAQVMLLGQNARGLTWQLADITDDFLHVLLINHLAAHKLGFFAHAAAVRDVDGRGLLFCGRSEAGKSTTARLWHGDPGVTVLNDDRVVVRRRAGRYFLYSVPWHGEFSRNFKARLVPARLRRAFFLYHAPRNTAERLAPAQAFSLLYPTIFPPFWDRRLLAHVSGFISALVRSVPSYRLGFAKDRRVIGFVRAIEAGSR